MKSTSVTRLIRFLKMVMVIFFFTQVGHAAFDITPIIVTVAPSGSKATVTVQATNNGDTKTPIQISIVHREPDINGKEDYDKGKDASDLFQIIPSQVILAPKEQRTIRITYVGEPRITQEQAFRFIAEEFPIDVSDATKVKNKTVAAISIVSRYVGSLYVKPAGVAPNLVVEAAPEKEAKETKMVLTMKNEGTEHQLFNDLKYTIVSGVDKKSYPITSDTMKVIGNHNILSGKVRKVSIPWPKEVPVGPVKIITETPAKISN